MKVLIAPDSFKGTLTAREAADAISQGVKSALPSAEIEICPIADGGEGTVDAIAAANADAKICAVQVHGPFGEKIKSKFLVFPDGRAVIEMAQASGLLLVPERKRNPSLTTTFGTGQLILAALDEGCTEIIVGIGGSATNDGGAGMAQALGVKFFDKDKKELAFQKDIGYCARSLDGLKKIDVSGIDMRIAKCRFTIASDVTNPLCGPQGAAAIYGPQKGADAEMVKGLDAIMQNYAAVIKRGLNIDVLDMQGAGAAGGLGAGLFAFLNAELERGADLVMELCDFEEKISDCDVVITGEGKIDEQTCHGKTIARVAEFAKEHEKTAIAIGGCLGEGFENLKAMGIGIVEASTKPAHSKKLDREICFADLREKTAEIMKRLPESKS